MFAMTLKTTLDLWWQTVLCFYFSRWEYEYFGHNCHQMTTVFPSHPVSASDYMIKIEQVKHALK